MPDRKYVKSTPTVGMTFRYRLGDTWWIIYVTDVGRYVTYKYAFATYTLDAFYKIFDELPDTREKYTYWSTFIEKSNEVVLLEYNREPDWIL